MRAKLLLVLVLLLLTAAWLKHHRSTLRSEAEGKKGSLFPLEFGNVSPEILGAMLCETSGGKLTRPELWGTVRDLARQKNESDKWIERFVDGYRWEIQHPFDARVQIYRARN